MPRCPAKDYADRCRVIELEADGLTHHAIAEMLHRPERWVRRTLERYDPDVGLASLRDHSSRPHSSPNRTSSEVEQAMCAMKQAHPGWGRRQISSQLRWQWRDEPARCAGITASRVRCVLKRHREFDPPAPPQVPPPRQIEYLSCNLLWAADCHQTRLADGSSWDSLQWIDLHSRFALGQVTAATLTEEAVVQSFLQVAGHYGLPSLIKTDLGSLFHEPTNGLPTLFERVVAALNVVHVPIGPRQPWWNGVIERRILTCRQEVQLPQDGDADAVNHAMEAERQFYNNERCHSRCADQPPATTYMPSPRLVPADFALDQVPVTLGPKVITRHVQAGGRISLLNHSYPFSQRYARQSVTVTVDGWTATAEAADGWTRTWDLHDAAPTQPAPPLPPVPPQPLLRKVDRRGCVHINHQLFYVGLAWATRTLTLQPQDASWTVELPDGSTKVVPNPHLLPWPGQTVRAPRPQTPPSQQTGTLFHTRRVTTTGQVAFNNRLYYAGVTLHGQTVKVIPLDEGLAVYNTDNAWVTTCPWPEKAQPVEPPCPT
jgi:Homeodomain-like domain/Integrase core domain